MYVAMQAAPNKSERSGEPSAGSEQPNNSSIAIDVDELHVDYGTHRAVNNVSFTVERGSLLALLGPNGAGKTTLIETLLALRKPTSGTARIEGLDPRTQQRELRRRVGAMLQDGGAYPSLNARQLIALFASFYRDAHNPYALLERVGIEARVAKTPVKHLSGGEKQRISLALALVGDPDVLFLDEPTSGVDAGGRLLLRQLIRQLSVEGVTIVLSTHDFSDAESLASHVLILDKGIVRANGSLDEVRSQHADVSVIRFATLHPVAIELLEAHLNVQTKLRGQSAYSFETSEPTVSVQQLSSWLASNNALVSELRTDRASLEEVFLTLTTPEPA